MTGAIINLTSGALVDESAGPAVHPGDRRMAVVELVQAKAANVASAYLPTGAGLQELP